MQKMQTFHNLRKLGFTHFCRAKNVIHTANFLVCLGLIIKKSNTEFIEEADVRWALLPESKRARALLGVFGVEGCFHR